MTSAITFQHFIESLDVIGWAVLSLLVFMSIGCWFLILKKGLELLKAHNQAPQAWRQLRSKGGIQALAPRGELGCMLSDGLFAYQQWRRSLDQGSAIPVVGDPLERALSQCLASCIVSHERGLTFLACVAAGAPFVGLFGTVMGIYHALTVIGTSGEAGLEQVAAPVGEALLMTACGLACAIPAVLAYNFFTRANRKRQANMERFAHELHATLTLGAIHSETA